MTVLTGADGQVLYGSTPFAKVRDFSFTVTKDAYEDTCLGSLDRTYIEGLRSTTGTCTLLYDPSNRTANNFLNTIFNTSGKSEEITFKMNRNGYPTGGGQLTCTGFLTSVSPSVAVGDVQAVTVSFQVSGKPTGGF